MRHKWESEKKDKFAPKAMHARCLHRCRCRLNSMRTVRYVPIFYWIQPDSIDEIYFLYHFRPSYFFDSISSSVFILSTFETKFGIGDVFFADYIFHFTISVWYFVKRRFHIYFYLFIFFDKMSLNDADNDDRNKTTRRPCWTSKSSLAMSKENLYSLC